MAEMPTWARARELLHKVLAENGPGAMFILDAALRREREDALERAAHRLEEIARDYEGRKLHSLAMDETVEATFLEQMARAAWRCVKAIYEMKSPAAAPAAETVRCMCPPGAVAASCPLRNDVQSICECRCHAAPPSEPAAPEKATGFSNADKPFAKLTEPAPLLPRVLAALEDRSEGCHLTPGRARDLAAELRVYIAADPERK